MAKHGDLAAVVDMEEVIVITKLKVYIAKQLFQKPNRKFSHLNDIHCTSTKNLVSPICSFHFLVFGCLILLG